MKQRSKDYEEKFNDGRSYTRNRKPSYSRDKRSHTSQPLNAYDKEFWTQGTNQSSRSNRQQLFNPAPSAIRGLNNMSSPQINSQVLKHNNNHNRKFNHMNGNFHHKHQQLYQPGSRPPHTMPSFHHNTSERKYLRPEHQNTLKDQVRTHAYRKDAPRTPRRGQDGSQ